MTPQTTKSVESEKTATAEGLVASIPPPADFYCHSFHKIIFTNNIISDEKIN